MNRVASTSSSMNASGPGRSTHSRRIAKIQERFNALPLDVQQEIMRLREPDARTSQAASQATLSLTSSRNHPEAA